MLDQLLQLLHETGEGKDRAALNLGARLRLLRSLLKEVDLIVMSPRGECVVRRRDLRHKQNGQKEERAHFCNSSHHNTHSKEIDSNSFKRLDLCSKTLLVNDFLTACLIPRESLFLLNKAIPRMVQAITCIRLKGTQKFSVKQFLCARLCALRPQYLKRDIMKTIIGIAITLLLISYPMCVSAGDESVFFPPDASTCVAGAQSLLVWDAVHNVICVPVPTCKPYQILFFDGHNLTCTPTP